MLQETNEGLSNVIDTPSLQTPPPALEIVAVEPGQLVLVGVGNSVPGSAVPVSRAVAVTTVLKVEPGAVDLPGRPVAERPRGVGEEAVPHRRRVAAQQRLRVERRRGDRSEHRSGPGIHGEHRALSARPSAS